MLLCAGTPSHQPPSQLSSGFNSGVPSPRSAISYSSNIAFTFVLLWWNTIKYFVGVLLFPSSYQDISVFILWPFPLFHSPFFYLLSSFSYKVSFILLIVFPFESTIFHHFAHLYIWYLLSYFSSSVPPILIPVSVWYLYGFQYWYR